MSTEKHNRWMDILSTILSALAGLFSSLKFSNKDHSPKDPDTL